MNEADEILILGLREIGCPIDPSVISLTDLLELDQGLAYQACVVLLRAIDPANKDLPETLPRHMSTRVSSCTNVAARIKELGYRREISYHQLLYPNAGDVRQVLMWLQKAIPETKDQKTTTGSGAVLGQLIGRELATLAVTPWSPRFCSGRTRHCILKTTSLRTPFHGRTVKNTPGLEKYFRHYLPSVSRQAQPPYGLPECLFEANLSIQSDIKERENEWNSAGLESGLNPLQYYRQKHDGIARSIANAMRTTLADAGSSSGSVQRLSDNLASLLQTYEQGLQRGEDGRFGRQVRFGQEEAETHVETLEEREKKLKDDALEMEERMNEKRQELESMKENMDSLAAKLRQIESQIAEEDTKRVSLQRDYEWKKRTFDLLPEADANILELQKIANSTSSHIVSLATEWEKHRTNLISELRKLQDLQSEKMSESRKQLEEIKAMRLEQKSCVESIRQKEEKYKQLVELFKSMPHDSSRAVYTRRIVEIVKSVKKQKVEIDKILQDTRSLQKEINVITESLNRSFALADELVYQDARKEFKGGKPDPHRKQAYKLLISVNEEFKKLTACIEDLGGAQNTSLTLDSKIDSLQSRTSSLNMQRVVADLSTIRADNSALKKRIARLVKELHVAVGDTSGPTTTADDPQSVLDEGKAVARGDTDFVAPL